jgi:hypothetical protein
VDASEGTSAEDDSADGSRGLAVRNTNVTAAPMVVDGHLGNDGNTHTAAHHAEDTAELATLENYLGIDARPITRSDGSVPKAVSVPEEKERFGAEIFERKRTTPGEFVAFRESGEKTFGEKGKGFELVPTDG